MILKVLLLSPLPPPSGGIATWTVRYEQYCKEHRIPVTIVNNALIGARKEKKSFRLSLWDELRRSMRIIIRLIASIQKENPDIIHINSSCSRFGIFRDCVCSIIGWMSSVPVVVQCHCNIQDQIRGKLAEFAFKVMVSMARHVFVLNRFSANYASRYADGRVSVVPNFADENDLFLRQTVSASIGHAVFVGHARKEKGTLEILKAAEQLPDIRFTFVGPVHEQISEMKKPDNVEMLGAQPHETVMDLLKKADIFLFPSYTEGFANALLEAMAVGLPVIATDVGANLEMLGTEGGIIVPVGDAAALVAAINKLDNDPAARMKMGTQNTQRVHDEYLLQIVMLRLMDQYHRICNAE